MNDDLLHLYHKLRARAATLPTTLVERLGCPFLPFPRDRWHEASHRLLIVGQEPWEWGFGVENTNPWPYPPIWSLSNFIDQNSSVDALTHGYRTHTYEIQSRYPVGPFGQASAFFIDSLSRDGIGEVLTTNLVRCTLWDAQAGDTRVPLPTATAQERQPILDWQRGCLSGEIQVLAPTSVLFLTGPQYDEVLRDEFPLASFERVPNQDARQVARVRHERLPAASFRTYHPGYLRRSGKWLLLKELADLLT